MAQVPRIGAAPDYRRLRLGVAGGKALPGGALMDRLVMQAGRALVRAMVGDDSCQACAAVAELWSLAYPAPEAQGVQAELDGLKVQVTRARRAGDVDSEQALEGYWQVKFQQLLSAEPSPRAFSTSWITCWSRRCCRRRRKPGRGNKLPPMPRPCVSRSSARRQPGSPRRPR